MVRETRHLWVGNLPENIREDRIREHFKRYGRVQSVKLLPRPKEDDGSSGLCATVAFMDIKSASKAHNMEHKLDERCLSTQYYEPAAIPGGSAAPLYVAPRFPHGPVEEHSAFERPSHFYERREGDAYLRRAPGYHAADPLRGRARERLYRNGPYTPMLERTPPTHHRPLANAWSYEGTPSVRYPPAAPAPEPYPEERRDAQPAAHKKRPKSSRSGSESGSNSGSSRSRSRSRSHSHSSSSSSQSGSSSCSSATSSPGTEKSCSPHSSHHGTVRSGRVGGVALQSTVSAPHTNNVSPAVHSEDRRPLAICVRNLPIRSSDTSLKDGLFHEYKKHGKVVSVKVVGQAGERYAIVCFKKPEDAEKALEESQDKLFFGCKIEVAPYQGYDVDDNEFRPYEAEQDEYHPKATRTLFIGNLEKDITASELRKHFEQFGEIIEIDIKKQGALSSYAFCQFSDITSVVKAMRTMDGEHLGNNRIKLGFGKSMPTNCVWVDGIAENVPEKYLNVQFHTFGTISHVTVDRERGHALIYFEQISCAQEAVREMRGFMLRGRKLQVDFASRECQEAFYEHLEKQGHAVAGGERPWERYDSNSREVQAGRFETTVVVPGSARFGRYDAPQRPRTASYNRSSSSSSSAPVAAGGTAAQNQGRSSARGQRVGQRYDYYDAEYPDRRYRNYDEFSQGSGASHDDSYEQELREYGYCQRERGDSSPSPITCESEGMRRSVAVVSRPVRSEKSSSPCEKVDDETAFKRHALQSVVVSDVSGTAPLQVAPPLPPPPSIPQHPPDIRHLQKERVHIQHLLEQLDDCGSSGEDDAAAPNLVPKKRMKLGSDECVVNPGSGGGSVGLCTNTVDGCFEGMNHGDGASGGTSLLVTTHNHRKSLSEVRRMSDTGGKHCSRRLSTDSLSKHSSGGRDVRETSADRLVSVQVYSPHPVCKRRKTGSSASESEDRVSCRSGKHSHHHHHHHNDVGSGMAAVSGSESVDGSRPGTPLCDERPENLLPPSEPRRIPRERTTTEGPLSLPLPRFAAQVLSASPRLSATPSKPVPSANIVASPPSVVTSPRPVSHPQPPLHPPPSPSPAPPPASPPPRPPSLSSSSSDSEILPPSPTLEERIRSLDEKYEKWSGSRALSAAGGDALAKLDASASERFRFRHKLLDIDINELQPSDIVKSVLAKRSVFDEDSKRLENFSDKYEPREFIPFTRTTSCFQSLRVKTDCTAVGRDMPQCGTPSKPSMSPSPMNTPTTPGGVGKIGTFSTPTATSQLPPRLMGTPSPLHSPSQPLPKSPFSGGNPITPSPTIKPHIPLSPVGVTPLLPQCSKLQTMPKTSSTVSPRAPGTGLPAAKGLQYPFPSHPPVLPTTTVATTTASNAIGLVSVSSAGVKPSLSVTVPTTATVTVLSPEVSRTCGANSKPLGTSSVPSSVVHPQEVTRPSVVRSVSSVTVLTTATSTKPSPEVTGRISLKLVSSSSSVLSTVSGRIPSPGVLRLSFAKPPATTVTTSAVAGSVLSPEVLRTPNTGVDTPKVPATTQGPVRTSSAMTMPPVTSRQTTSVISSPQVTSRTSITSSGKVSICTVTTSMSGNAKSSRPVEHQTKVTNTVLMRAEVSRTGSNIPCIKSPNYTSSNDSLSSSSNNPRVVIIPVSISSNATPTVTTVAAASTVTTTVLTVTMASISTTSVTSTTSTTSAAAAANNSAAEGAKHNVKSKSCVASKKDLQVVSGSKDKQCDSSSSSKSVPANRKDIIPSSATSSPTKKDSSSREVDNARISGGHKSNKCVTISDEWKERKETAGTVCVRRDSDRETENSEKRRERGESIDSVDRRKERDTDCGERERRKDSHSSEADKDRRRDSSESIEREKRKEKDASDGLDRERRRDRDSGEITERRKEVPDFEEKERWKEGHMNETERDRWKDREEVQEKERRKDNSLGDSHKDMDSEKERRKEKRKDRTSSSSSPASIGCKRRMSSQDSVDSMPDDAKRLKLSPCVGVERRDSKDSGRSSSSSKRSSGEKTRHSEKSFSKLLEDKIREERKQGKDELDRRREDKTKLQDSCERHKLKDKQKKKSKSDRESPKDHRDVSSKLSKEVPSDKDFSPRNNKKKDDSEPEEKEEKHKHLKKDKEKKKLSKEEFVNTETTEEKSKSTKKDREKRNSSERRKEENNVKEEQKNSNQKSKSQKKDFSHSDTDSEDGSCDGPKKHSIFDIVDDGPAYISMYDKVKARSTKNMQKQEEEKRQEKMREKFNLLKQSRAKREEKKRSTSWDEDSDSDNPDRERGGKSSKRLAKLMISSSSEDDGRTRSVYECDEMKLGKSRPVVRIKKEDICMGDSDSDAQPRSGKAVVSSKEAKRLEGLEEDDMSSRPKHLPSTMRKGSRSKLVSDTSEDDTAATVSRFKHGTHKIQDIYSADSEIDLDYVDSDDKHCNMKKPNAKSSKSNKNTMDLPNDDGSPKKIVPDISKIGLEKQAALKKITAKSKIVESSDDEAVKKLPCDPVKSDMFGDDKQAIFRKSIAKNKACKILIDSSEDDNARKLLAESMKIMSFSDDKQANFKKFSTKNKVKASLDSSDDDCVRKNMTDSLKNDMYEDLIHPEFKKVFNKSKAMKMFPDSSTEDSKGFSLHGAKDEVFTDSSTGKGCIPSKVESAIENVSDVEVSASTPPQLEKVVYYSNSVGKGSECSRKKSHKKKQKRQKNQSTDEVVGKLMGDLDSEPFDKLQADDCAVGDDNNKIKVDGERKRHKRERRKSTYSKSDGDGKPLKARKKKSIKPELGVLKAESNLKREEKMEDIFGPLSDDSEPGHVKTSPPTTHGSGRTYDKMADKWQVSLVYASDSDSNIDHSLLNSSVDCFSPTDTPHSRTTEKERKRREKKRRERKVRDEESLTVDLAEAGRVLEAKLLGDHYANEMKVKDENESVKQETTVNDVDVFRFTDGDESLEMTKTKEKKKKRKKSKEEKQSRREHHHHHHHEKNMSKSSPERRMNVTPVLEEVKSPPQPSPSLPSLDVPSSPPDIKPSLTLPTENTRTLLQCRESIISTASKISPVSSKSNEKKKLDKFIPGFGSEIDDTIHETAVKSISEFEAPKTETMLGVKVEEPIKQEDLLPKVGDGLAVEEEKPRAVISQEETEDAVKALLGESFGRGFNDCYSGEGNAPPANTSEPQLPTDEEDETRKAVEGLIDMKPDTPQSEHELQIDTDTEDNADDSYPGLQYRDTTANSAQQSLATPDANDFSAPSKTSDIQPPFYRHSHVTSVKTYNLPPSLSKPEIEQETVMSPLQEADLKVRTPIEAEPVEVKKEVAEPPVVEVTGEPTVLPLEPEVVVPLEVKAESNIESDEREQKVRESNKTDTNEDVPPSRISIEPVEEVKPAVAITEMPPSLPPVIDSSIPQTGPPEMNMKVDEEESKSVEQIPLKTEENPPEEKMLTSPAVDVEAKENSLCRVEEVVDHREGVTETVVDSNILPCVANKVQEMKEDQQEEEKSGSDFVSSAKEEPVCDVRESEFSEPEPDMKTDNDFVSSLLASESMNGELSDDGRPVFVARREGSFGLFKECDPEAVSVIKETESRQLSYKNECDPFAPLPSLTKPSDSAFPTLPAVSKPTETPFTTVPSLTKVSETPFTSVPSLPKAPDTPFTSLPSQQKSSENSFPSQQKVPDMFPSIPQPKVPEMAFSSLPSLPKTQEMSFTSLPSLPKAPELPFQPLSVPKVPESAFQTLASLPKPAETAFSPLPSLTKAPDSETKVDPSRLKEDDDEDEFMTSPKGDSNDPNKGDSDFWSAKDVNIDSVIKKVDALCSVEEENQLEQTVQNNKITENEDKSWLNTLKEKEVAPAIEEKQEPEAEKPVIQEQNIPKVSKPEEDKDEVSSSTEHDIPCVPSLLTPEDREDHRITSASSPDERDHMTISASSPEGSELDREGQCHSTVTPRTSRRGRRGTGGRRKVATRSSTGVTTRRSRLMAGQKNTELTMNVTMSPRRGGRAPRGAKVTHESLSQVNKKLTTDVYEFHDDSEDESSTSAEKGRPRLILTIKSPVSASSVSSSLGKDSHSLLKPPQSPLRSPIVETREEFPSPPTPTSATITTATTTSNSVISTSTSTTTTTTTTRKSRRLQERDGCRSTVDDVIEDVVRGTIVTRSAAAAAAATGTSISPRRSTRQNNSSHRFNVPFVETRKSPRGGRKSQAPSRIHDEHPPEEKKKPEEESQPLQQTAEAASSPPAGDTAGKEASPEKSVASMPLGSAVMRAGPSTPGSIVPVASPNKEAADAADREPMTLIDPVTGLLIPMRESEEGQYIPVTTTLTDISPTTTSASLTADAAVMKLGEPVVQSAGDKLPVRTLAAAPSSSVKVLPSTARGASDSAISTSPLWLSGVPQKSHVPVISTSATVSTGVPAVRPPAICKPSSVPASAVVTNVTVPRPVTTLKAHVLQQATKPVPSVNVPVQQQQQPQQQQQQAQQQPTGVQAIKPVAKPREVLQNQQTQMALNTAKSTSSSVPMNPKAHLLQAVAVSKPMAPSTLVTSQTGSVSGAIVVSKSQQQQQQPPPQQQQQQPQQQQQTSVVNMKTVTAATPINPKTHLLQAAPKTATSSATFSPVQAAGSGKGPPHHPPIQGQVGRSTTPPLPKSHVPLVAVAGTKSSAPSPPLPMPSKTHHSLAQQPILTGAVASPPLKASHHGSQQPIVTGASSSRVNLPKSQVPGALLVSHGKNLIDPPKVDVTMGGCIVVPSASPQQRGQVLQAGLPVPAYEASLHAGSAGVVAELLPNPQFVLARQSPPPAHQHGGQGEVVQHVGYSHNLRVTPHDLAGHYVHPQLVYQQYFRAQQEALGAHIPAYHMPGVRSPMIPSLDVKSDPDSDEARGSSSPPLELRRPSSGGSNLGARGGSGGGGGMAAHNLQSPHDRATDSPQVATVYVHGARLPHYTPPQGRYYEPGAEPPPAHLRAARHHHPMPGTEAPANQPRLQVATPPHASQVPPQADSLLMLLQRYPVMWQGLLALKNDQAAVQMHFVFGNPHVARDSLPCNSDGSTPPLRIAQRMRLEPTQLDGVARKMQIDHEHCMLLALPCGRDHMDVLQQSNNLQTGFITYLQQKQAAGIVNIAHADPQQNSLLQAAYVVHIFPACDFANENLARIAPDLLHRVADIAHLLIVIASV